MSRFKSQSEEKMADLDHESGGRRGGYASRGPPGRRPLSWSQIPPKLTRACPPAGTAQGDLAAHRCRGGPVLLQKKGCLHVCNVRSDRTLLFRLRVHRQL